MQIVFDVYLSLAIKFIKMRTLSIVIFSLFVGNSFSQTKLIAHKSHSGSDKNFRIAIEANLFDSNNANFGEIVNEYTENYEKIDSIIKISPTKIVRVKSNYYQVFERADKSKVGKLEYLNTVRDTITTENTKILSNNELKTLVKSDKKYIKSIDTNKVVIVDFKEKSVKKTKKEKQQANKKKKKSALPIVENKTNFPSKPLLIFALLTLGLMVAFFTWKTTSFKTLASN